MIRVFVSHNSRDDDAVKRLAAALAERDVEAIVDDEQRPHVSGVTSWIEQMMSESDAILVCVGPAGLGGWQRAEIDVAIAMQIDQGKRVMTALLPGASKTPDLPAMLKRYPWEDLSDGFDQARLERLAFVITGRRPAAAPTATTPARMSGALRPVAATPGDDAITYLVDTLLKGRNVTFFVGNRHGVAAGDQPMQWDLSRQLLVDLGLLEPTEDYKLLPTLDNVGAYYAYQRGADGLEGRIRDRTSRSAMLSDAHLGIAHVVRHVAALRERIARNAASGLATGRPQLIVTTRLDLMLERALLTKGLSFTRIVQARDGTRVESSFSGVEVLPAGGVRVTAGAGRARSTLTAATPAELDGIVSRPDLASRTKAGASLSLARAEPLVVYKYHGSNDVENSCAITTDQLFDAARNVRVPQALAEIIVNTPSVFVGCGILDTDFRHLYHAVLAELFDRKIAPYERYALQLPPGREPDDRSRRLEAGMWDNIKRRSLALLGISILEERPEEFASRLVDALGAAGEQVA